MAKGYRPAWVGQQRYEWFYLYGAVEPLSGRSLLWLLPDWTKESAQFFLEQLRQQVAGEIALVWDRAGSHRAMAEKMPEGITPVFLPRASPELNPIEQVWKALRKELANRIFEGLGGDGSFAEILGASGGVDLDDGVFVVARGAGNTTGLNEISITFQEPT